MSSSVNLAGALAALMVVAVTPALAQEASYTVLASDISGSSTFVVDQNSANDAATYVEKYIAGLEAPHELYMMSVGDVGRARRLINVQATVTTARASSARKLAKVFGGYFRSLPGLTQRGEIVTQSTTSLIAFFHAMKPLCAKGARLIVFTDGLEWSSAVDGKAFAAGKISLPKPDDAFLSGCAVTMLGIGQVKSTLSSDGLEERLVPEWETFLSHAGAEPATVRGSFFSF